MHPARIAFAIAALACVPSFAQTTTRVSVNSAGEQANGRSGYFGVAISADGRFVAFESGATNLDPARDYAAGLWLHDRQTGSTTLVSVDSTGLSRTAGGSWPSVSANGRFVAFDSSSPDLVPNDTRFFWDIFVRDVWAGMTARVSETNAGGLANGDSYFPCMSADGRFVAFVSEARNLLSPAPSPSVGVYRRDLWNGTTALASVDSTGRAALDVWTCAISGDGRYVAFVSGDSLIPEDTNHRADVYIHDFLTGATERVSGGYDGEHSNGPTNTTLYPSLSADGRFVAFSSDVTDLVPGDTIVGPAVLVRDRETSTTWRIDVDPSGRGTTATFFARPVLSADGRYVAFAHGAPNLVPDDTNGVADVFVRNIAARSTARVSLSSAGLQGNGSSGLHCPAISADGRFVAFPSDATSLVSGDTNGVMDVFVRDLRPVGLTLVVPAVGSEAGGDLVHLDGWGFDSSTTVTFGGVLATVEHVASTRLDARTPPGAGVADVTASGSQGAAILPTAFTYVEPALAARYGNVNEGYGDREDVLLVNAVTGDPFTRELSQPIGLRLQVVVLAPSTRARAAFALYLWTRAPSAATWTPLPRGLGAGVLAPPFAGGSPLVIWNNAGYRRVLGSPTLPSSPAPSILASSPRGIHRPLTVTLQGLIQDDGSQIPEGWSVTNAVILYVR